MSAPFPWLFENWRGLVQSLTENALGHAYLLSGREGLGKFAFASAFAALALCEDRRDDSACGECRSCLLVQAGNHPDLKIIVTEEDRKQIVIDQVRELINFYTLRPHYGGHKIAVIYPADALNHNAANALLKVLEEPPSGALLLLPAHRPGLLPATVNSRCQKIALNEPDWATCIAWLEAERAQHAGMTSAAGLTLAGAPLDIRAQLLSEDGPPFDRLIETVVAIAAGQQPVLVAARMHAGIDVRRFLDAFDLLLRAVQLQRVGQSMRELRVAERHQHRLQEISNKLNSKRLFFFLDQIASARAVVLRSGGVRGAEIIENLFYAWANLTQTEGRV